MTDPEDRSADKADWLNWPLSAWADRLRGAPGGWFRIDGRWFCIAGRRFGPTFQVATDVDETFDAMGGGAG